MSTDITGLIVAVVGVAGTLTAPVVTQRLAIRARQQELDAAQRQRSEERDTERRHAELADRRAAYIELNATMRAFRRAIRDDLTEHSDESYEELELARRAFDRRIAEAQLTSTDVVLKALRPVTDMVFRLHDDVVRIDTHEHEDPWAAERARNALLEQLNREVSPEVQALREAMRTELGVSGDGAVEDPVP